MMPSARARAQTQHSVMLGLYSALVVVAHPAHAETAAHTETAAVETAAAEPTARAYVAAHAETATTPVGRARPLDQPPGLTLRSPVRAVALGPGTPHARLFNWLQPWRMRLAMRATPTPDRATARAADPATTVTPAAASATIDLRTPLAAFTLATGHTATAAHPRATHVRVYASTAANPAALPVTRATAAPPPFAKPTPPPLRSPFASDSLDAARDVAAPLPRFGGQVQIGYSVDGAASSGANTLDGAPRPEDQEASRAFAFGNAVLVRRGVGVGGLNAFVAATTRITSGDARLPIADIAGTRNLYWMRSVWAEVRNILPFRRSAPLTLRAGRFYSTAVWPVHLDGLMVHWHSPAVSAQALTGESVETFTSVEGTSKVLAARGSIDFKHVRGKLPLLFATEYLRYAAQWHHSASLSWQPRGQLRVTALGRWFAGAAVQQDLSLRAQLAARTNIVAQLSNRSARDWQWDPRWAIRRDDVTEARRYLELGVPVPQWRGGLLLGTVLAENVDVYLRTTFVLDRSLKPDRNDARTSWIEASAAAEVRVRGALTLTASAMLRDYRRPLLRPFVDEPIQPDRLLRDGHAGEQSVAEGGGGARFGLGPRSFTAQLEGYVRRTRFAETYQLIEMPRAEQVTTYVGGGRFSVDAWVSPALRIAASYELSTHLARAPEIIGWKNLKLMLEGTL